MATALMIAVEKRRPKMPFIRKPASGSAGMSQSCIRTICSILHRVHLIDVQRRPILEHRKDNRQTHSRLCGCYHHDEEGKQMSVHLLELVRKRDEGQVHG